MRLNLHFQSLLMALAALLCGLELPPAHAAGASAGGAAPDTPGARAIILHEPGMPVRGAASSAPVLGQILEGAGLKVRLVSARELAAPATLDAQSMDLLVIPTGQSFPAAARESLIQYLRAGGNLITMGGYAFENLLREVNGQWLDREGYYAKLKKTPAQAGTSMFIEINTAWGIPKNEMKLTPERIGMFDACYPLKRVARVARDEDQQIVRQPLDLKGEIKGWAASGIVGDYDNNGIDFLKCKIATNARWVSLLQAFDRFGRPRGPAAAAMMNFNGFYANSNWAYFGIENFDLFKEPQGPGARLLQELARFLARGTYLQQLTLERRLMRRGETVEAEAVVRNTGRWPQAVRIGFATGPAGKRGLAPRETRELRLAPGEVKTVRVRLGSVDGEATLGQVTASLQSAGEPIDELATGYVVERPEAMRQGAELRFAGNYFTRNGRPSFLFGSDETAYVYLTPHENPLTWSRDLLAARDIGMDLYENLQYSRPGHLMGDFDWRNFRAMAQLTQQYNMVFMPGLLVVHDAAVDDTAIAEEDKQCDGYARVLRDVPGLLYYINGDYKYVDDGRSPEQRKRWNDYLRERYQTTTALRLAWGASRVKGEIGSLEIPNKITREWNDPVAIDLVRFSRWVAGRWNRAHVSAIRGADMVHPITSEFYNAPLLGIHLRETIDGQDVANICLFLPTDAMPSALRWNDLRSRGKGMSVGEYGMQAHPLWTRERETWLDYTMPRTEEQQSRLFTTVAHYGLGMGATKIQNWCLRDAQHRSVHPWGIMYPNGTVPKDVSYIHRNLSLIWRHFTPKYVAPPVAVCIPLNLGRGLEKNLECAVSYRAFDTLMELHQDFNVFDDDNLENLGPETKFMIYPSPFAVSDAAYGRLLAWVRAGGTLLVTGDFTMDETRRRTRTSRLRELAGVELVSERIPDVNRDRGQSVRALFTLAGVKPMDMKPCLRLKAAGAEVLGKDLQGEPLLVRQRLDRGMVYYAADGLELSADKAVAEARRQIYGAVLQSAGQVPLAVEPNVPWLQVMAQPTARGMVHTIVNTREGRLAVPVTLATAAGPVTLATRDRWPAMAAVTADGRLVAAFADARVNAGGASVMDGTGLKGILSLDGQDVSRSRALLVAPWEAGEVRLPRAGGMVAVVGDFRQGQWTELERETLDKLAPRVKIDADRATCLILVCPAEETKMWQVKLTGAILNPERIEGY